MSIFKPDDRESRKPVAFFSKQAVFVARFRGVIKPI